MFGILGVFLAMVMGCLLFGACVDAIGKADHLLALYRYKHKPEALHPYEEGDIQKRIEQVKTEILVERFKQKQLRLGEGEKA